MASSPLEIFCRTLVEEYSIGKFIIVSDGFVVRADKSKVAGFDNESDSSLCASFSRWDSLPRSWRQQQQEEEEELMTVSAATAQFEQEDEKVDAYSDILSSSDSTSTFRHTSSLREPLFVSPPRLPVRKNSAGRKPASHHDIMDSSLPNL